MRRYIFCILLIIFQQAHGDLKGCRIEYNAIRHILRKGFDEFQGATNGDTKRINTRFETLQEATFENTNQRDLPSKLEVILLLPGPLIAFQAVVCEVE